MLANSFKKSFVISFQDVISLFSFFVLSASIATTIVENVIINRENAIELLGPTPNGIVDRIMKIAPYGQVQILIHQTFAESFNNYNIFFLDPRLSISLKKGISQFYKRYKRLLAEEKNALVFVYYHTYTDWVFMPLRGKLRSKSSCIANVIANDIIPGSTLLLATGRRTQEKNFLGYDILQEAVCPSVYSFKYHQSSVVNKLLMASELIFLCLTCFFKQNSKSHQ